MPEPAAGLSERIEFLHRRNAGTDQRCDGVRRSGLRFSFISLPKTASEASNLPLTSRHQNSYALMMRTTLTIDDDVAARLERLRRNRRTSLKDLINEALRRGLNDMGRRRSPREPIATRAVALGRVRIASIDNIAEALAIVEGESFK
jgi:hypothetical protein